tara:strand:- start:2 stop:1252 length:1251 start_codon:yes stop_codon:yes gene_type:complete
MGFVRKTAKSVSNVLKKVDDVIIQPVVNTIEAVAEDPKKLAIIALAVTVPGAGAAIGSALAPAAAVGTQAVIGSAVMGGLTAEATGGKFIKGAVLGGVASGLSNVVSPAVKEAAGGGTLGNVTAGAVTGATNAALKGGNPLLGATFGGVSGLAAPLPETDASFMAADAAQLAEQGLSESQIVATLSSNYASTAAAQMAANLAVNNTPIQEIINNLTTLSNTTGLSPVTTTDAELIAADALGIYEASSRDNNFSGLNNELLNKGTNIGAVEQNLIASGLDPLVAADVANQIALNPTISVNDLSGYLSNFYGDNIYDVKDLNFDPTAPADTRPEGERVGLNADTIKKVLGSSQNDQPTNMSNQGMFANNNMPTNTNSENQASDASTSLTNINVGSAFENPYARDVKQRQSLISGLFNL